MRGEGEGGEFYWLEERSQYDVKVIQNNVWRYVE